MKKALIRISAFAAAVSTLGLCFGCSPDKQSSDTPEKISLVYWAPMDSTAGTVINSYSELDIYKEFEKETGIHIEFKHPPVGQEKEQFNLMIASRELPDIIEYDWVNSYPGGTEKAIKDNIIINLNEYIDKGDAPNYKKVLDENPDILKQVKSDSKNIATFPGIGINAIQTTAGPLIRQDWLDDLGLQAPQTIADWTNVLTAFKEKKGASAPLTGQITDFTNNYTILCAFGIGSKFYQDNGTVKYGPLEQNYKEYISLLKDWYDKGLLDPDFFSNNSKAVESNVLNNKSGALYGYIGSSLGTYNNAKNKDASFDLTGIQYPVMHQGETPQFVQYTDKVRTAGMLAITTKNKFPEETIKLIDKFYSEKGNLLKNFGIEGKTYTMENGEPKYTDLILKNPDGLSVSQALAKFTRAATPSAGLIDPRYHEQYYVLPQQKQALEIWNRVSANAEKVKLPPITPTQEEADELSTITTTVNAYCDEMFVKFITGAESMDHYDTFVQQMKQMNIDKALKIYQDALARYNNR